MKKIIKKVGKAVAIILTKEEQQIYKAKVGDVFNIELVKESKR